ncbi:MAG TPA: hypothetical protein VJY85_08550, partial [Candidatus Limnocylindria bacterium]|nr:hypothetical protein [Candidatus Limnocylindria bacterium]
MSTTRGPLQRLAIGLSLAAILAGCGGAPFLGTSPTPSPLAGREHESHETLAPDATPFPDRHSDELELAGSLPKNEHSFDFFNSDMAFWGDTLVQGSYDGFRLVDISQPTAPRLIADVECRGPQGDVSIWEDLVFVSVDRPQTSPGCDSEDAEKADPLFVPPEGGWEGIRVFDVSEARRPRLITSVATDCGSHTNTLVPDPDHDRLLLYVSSYALSIEPDLAPGCVNPHGHISVVEVPLDDPASASVIAEPHLFDTPVWEVWPGASEGYEDTAGCHDITIYEPKHLAAAACMSQGQIWDIS